MKAKPVKKKPKAKRAVAAKPRTPKLDWDEIESSLHALATRTIKEFAKKHPAEFFYAFFFDFPAQWGHIRIHLNSPAMLRQRAAEYIASNPELYARRSVEAVANDIRWEAGDFGYFEINNTRGWKLKWHPIAEQVEAAAAAQKPEVYSTGDFIELRFLLMVSRVLLRMERDGLLQCLPRTRNFRTCCLRHEERPEDAWKRMHLLRQQLAQDDMGTRQQGKTTKKKA